MTNPVTTIIGSGPIILGMPHTGTNIPRDIFAKLNGTGRDITDTDWHIDKLYAGLLEDVTVVKANFSRYVIDANRDPYGVSLYPGQNTTTLCPTTDFEGQNIYLAGMEPSATEIESRRIRFHKPYHDEIKTQIERLKSIHDHVILYDCHSIRSVLPFLFEGELPALNIGTNDGVTCAKEIEQQSFELCSQSPFGTVLNGRFKGGWTTRHYADPSNGVHTIQMETAQNAYLTEEKTPWTYDPQKADELRPVLVSILTHMTNYVHQNGARSGETNVR